MEDSLAHQNSDENKFPSKFFLDSCQFVFEFSCQLMVQFLRV